MAQALTALAVKNAKPKIGGPLDRHNKPSKYAGQLVRTELLDAEVKGLRLVVQPSGEKSWAVRYRHPHTRKPAKKTWRFDLYSLADIRLQAKKALRMVEEGIDPNAPVPVPVPASETAFEKVWERYFREWTKPGQAETRWQQGNAQAYESRFLPLWRGRDVASITRLEVRALLKGIAAEGHPYMANLVKNMLSRFFSWCIDVELVPASPIVGLKSEPEKERERVLSMDELRTLWLASDKVGWPWGPIIKLLMLTGQRLSEIAAMRWSEINRKTRTLSLPGTRTKNGKPHDVPLSSLAMSVIEDLPRIGELVFLPHPAAQLSITHGKNMLNKAMAEVGTPVVDWRRHDLRRSFVTHTAELGVPPHIVEALVNHVSGHKGGVAGVYNRAVYAPEKKAAMELWGVTIEKLVSKRRR